MPQIAYEDTIYNNSFQQPWDTDPDYLAERRIHLEHWRPLRQAIEDIHSCDPDARLPPDLVIRQKLAQAERRSIVFKHFLRRYEATVTTGQPLDYYQQQYQETSATKATHAGEVCQGLFVLQ